MNGTIRWTAVLLVLLMLGCRQRPPKDGTVERTRQDGIRESVTFAEGRETYRLERRPDGGKFREVFSAYTRNDAVVGVRERQPDRDSTVLYAENGSVSSYFIIERPADDAPWRVTGRSFHPDGSLASVVDSSGMRMYHPSGRLSFERRSIGPGAERQTYYDSLGTVMERWETLDGARHGRRYFDDRKRGVIEEELYDRGRLVKKLR